MIVGGCELTLEQALFLNALNYDTARAVGSQAKDDVNSARSPYEGEANTFKEVIGKMASGKRYAGDKHERGMAIWGQELSTTITSGNVTVRAKDPLVMLSFVKDAKGYTMQVRTPSSKCTPLVEVRGSLPPTAKYRVLHDEFGDTKYELAIPNQEASIIMMADARFYARDFGSLILMPRSSDTDGNKYFWRTMNGHFNLGMTYTGEGYRRRKLQLAIQNSYDHHISAILPAPADASTFKECAGSIKVEGCAVSATIPRHEVQAAVRFVERLLEAGKRPAQRSLFIR